MSQKSSKKNDLLGGTGKEAGKDIRLLELQSILSTAEEVAQMGSWRWDLQTQKVTWSDQMYRLFGVEREGFDGDVNRVVAERIHPDDVAAVNASNRNVLEQGHPVPLSYRIVLPDGTERTVWAQGKLMRDEAGKPIALAGYVQDITERVRVEKKILQMKRLYVTLSQVNQTIVRVKHRDELYRSICDVAVRFGEFSLAWVGLLDEDSGNVNPVAVSGMNLADWQFPMVNIHSADYQHGLTVTALRSSAVVISEDLKNVEGQTTPQMSRLRELGYRSLAGIPFRLRDRVIGILILASSEQGLFQSDDELRLLDEMGLDISFALDTMETEKVKRQWANAFEYCAHGLAIELPSANIILTCNPAFARQQGRTVEEVSSMKILQQYAPQNHEYIKQCISQSDRIGHAQFEANMIRKDGGVYPAQVDMVSVRDENGNLLYRVVTQQDIAGRKQAEEALRESEDKFKYVFDKSTVAKSITGVEGTLHINRAFCEMLGYSEQELNDRHWQEFTHPDDIELNLNEVKAILDGKKESARFIKRYIHRNGGIVWVDVNTSLRRDANGNPLYFMTTVLDVTERKQAEEALRESEEKMHSIFRVAPTGIGVVKDRVLLDVNPRICEMTGYAKEELVGQSARMLYPTQEDFDFVGSEKYRQIAQKGTGQVETRWQKKDGSVIDVLLASTPIDLADLSRGVTFIALDITERKQAEEVIRQSERQMKALLTSLDDIVFEIDQDGTYLNIWTGDENLLAQPKANMLGKQVLEVMGGEHGSQFAAAIQRVAAGGNPESIEYPLNVMGGQNWFMARVSPILDTESPGRTVSVLVRDITERKRVEEQVRVQLRRVRALNEIDRAISSSLDMRLSLDILLNQTLSQLEVDAACVLLLNPSSQTLEYVAGKGFQSLTIHKSRVLLGQDVAGQAGLERKTIHMADLQSAGEQFLRKDLLQDEKFVEYFGVPLIAKGLLKGVLEVFHRTPLNPDLEWENYLETLGGQAAIAIDNAQLFDGMQRSNLELITAYDATIEGWSRAMDLRDKETEGHTLRVTELTVKLAKMMNISQQEITHMRRGALLHDIGKLGVPDNILHKPDKLDRIEWAVMRQHPTYAFNMLMSIAYLRPALDIPYCHHEKWDGTGYPRGLKGGEIPLAARAFAVVDVWDALRSDRPYRKGWEDEKVREYIIEESGKHFDPQMVEAFMKILEEE